MEEEGLFELEFFRKSGFSRRKCIKCGSPFWSTDGLRKTCGDSPCDSYSFIGNTPTKDKYTVSEMRDVFISYFSGSHKVVNRYPVVPRWRDDVLLVNASIYDFQPHVTMGYAQPPGNPIVMSQPCIRMIDVDNVGKTGRHLTSFEMMCHDSFNYPNKKVYWKEGTVEYCNSFLVDRLGIPQKLVTYKENPWSGGGNAGSALEVLVLGLEVVTLVFMDLIEDADGDYEVEGQKYRKMPIEVVDTGYGLERLAWLTSGTETIYETVYPEMLEFLKSKMPNHVDPTVYSEGLYVLADHSRTLLWMLSDSVIPSNVKVGYIARMLVRRCLRTIDYLGLGTNLVEIVKKQYELYGALVPEYSEKFVETILGIEIEKYRSNIASGEASVGRIFKKHRKLDVNDLIALYDSHGLTPDFVRMIVKEKFDYDIDVPEDFHSRVVSLHSPAKQEKAKPLGFPPLETRPLYYDDTSIKDFTALVLNSGDGYVILNQTAFYPEGGGQPCDLGYIKAGNKTIRVTNVQKYGKTIVHFIEGNIPEKSRIQGFIDYERRRQLMIHHSATHLILGVMKEVLGKHVWQNGVQKEIDYSRIDISHYAKISEGDIEKIERRCLEVISQKRSIKVMNVEWNKAIEKFGFTLFQGGVPLDSKVRVVEIEGIDVEGCGGTHLNYTSEINVVKVISTETIQEGIQRVIFVAGPASLRNHQSILSLMRDMQEITHSRFEDIPSRTRTMLETSMSQKREIVLLKNQLLDRYIAGSTAASFGKSDVLIGTGLLPPEIQDLYIPRLLGMRGKVGLAQTGDSEFIVVSSSGGIPGILAEIPEMVDLEISGNDRVARVRSGKSIGEKINKLHFK